MSETFAQINLREAKEVSITFGECNQIWVNVDGICRLRVMRCEKFIVENNPFTLGHFTLN